MVAGVCVRGGVGGDASALSLCAAGIGCRGVYIENGSMCEGRGVCAGGGRGGGGGGAPCDVRGRVRVCVCVCLFLCVCVLDVCVCCFSVRCKVCGLYACAGSYQCVHVWVVLCAENGVCVGVGGL
jgi:hypothetical protein